MTDAGKQHGAKGPPWSVDLLADLHAGALDDTVAAQLWPQIEADPEAIAVLDALNATRTDLAALRAEPAPAMPVAIAARIDTALATAAGPTAGPTGSVVDLSSARRRRNVGWGAGLLAAAAAIVAAAAIAIPTPTTEGTPVAEAPPAPTQTPMALRSDEVHKGLGGALGVRDYGPLIDRDGLSECLSDAGFDPRVQPAGVRQVIVDGAPAVLVVLTTGQHASYRLVAFAPDCGVLSDEVVGATR